MNTCMLREGSEYHNKQITAIKLVLFINNSNTHEDKAPPSWYSEGTNVSLQQELT